MIDNTDIICQCGCGGVIPPKRSHRYSGIPKFLPGHFARVRKVQARSYVPLPTEIPSGICECGCGQRTEIAKVTIRERRAFKGHPLPRLPGHGTHRRGADHHLWKGGTIKRRDGYVMQYAPDHPRAMKGYVAQHRLVVELRLGRRLEPTEHVHHINGIKDDNRIENLVVLTHAEHRAAHAGQKHKTDHAKMSAAGKKGAEARWRKKP